MRSRCWFTLPKIIWVSAWKPGLSWLERNQYLIIQYMSGFCANTLYNVLYISSLETRNLPLNLLQQWQARILCRAFNYLKGQCSNIPVRFRSWVWSGSHFEKNWIRVLQFTLVGCIKCTSTVKGQKTYIFYLAILNHSYLFLERKWGEISWSGYIIMACMRSLVHKVLRCVYT